MIDVANLRGFLLDRYDEQEQTATETLAHNGQARARGLASTRWDELDVEAQQTLREVAAYRRIVEEASRRAGVADDLGRFALSVLTLLAYAHEPHEAYARIMGADRPEVPGA